MCDVAGCDAPAIVTRRVLVPRLTEAGSLVEVTRVEISLCRECSFDWPDHVVGHAFADRS